MPASHAALVARAEPSGAEAEAEADATPRPRIFPVPSHEPWTDWPRAEPQPGPRPGPAPEAGQDSGGGPAAARAGLADPAGDGQAGPRQFAVLLIEALAGVRPVRQLRPWLSERGSAHLHRLLPLSADGRRPRITRVLTTRPTRDVIEMTLIVTVGPRTRALAVRLERVHPVRRPAASAVTADRWHCTDIEAA